jgi:ecotin
MMIKMIAFAMWLGCVALSAVALSDDNMKAFPPAEQGMVRFVLSLPEREDETLVKVELIVGKTEMLDEPNRYFYGGKIEEETIEGWGFPKYVVTKLGPMAGTRIGVAPDAPKVKRFITLGGDPYLIRYNSRLPIVIYVPTGVEVRYRLWTTEPDATAMDQG